MKNQPGLRFREPESGVYLINSTKMFSVASHGEELFSIHLPSIGLGIIGGVLICWLFLVLKSAR